jgi:ubiquinone/menaquinone biosynthesis C-methylase UbiE
LKDLFSAQSDQYRAFRPQYPDELVHTLSAGLRRTTRAWDACTGNGQFAIQQAHIFDRVYATDSSANQIAYAMSRPNIEYAVETAEACTLPDQSVDLVTVAQAAHWLDLDAFYREVRRVCRLHARIALIGYGLVQAQDQSLQAAIEYFYQHVIGPYWEPERAHVDNAYRSLLFPFPEIALSQSCFRSYDWTLEQWLGYFSSWSAVSAYRRLHPNQDPLASLMPALNQAFSHRSHVSLQFHYFVRLGNVHAGNPEI